MEQRDVRALSPAFPRHISTAQPTTDMATTPFPLPSQAIPGTCCAGVGTCPDFQGLPEGQAPQKNTVQCPLMPTKNHGIQDSSRPPHWARPWAARGA